MRPPVPHQNRPRGTRNRCLGAEGVLAALCLAPLLGMFGGAGTARGAVAAAAIAVVARPVVAAAPIPAAAIQESPGAAGGDEEAKDLGSLVAQLDDEASSKRREAVMALQASGSRAIPLLVDVLDSPRERVRRGAAEALGRMGEVALTALGDALASDDERVRGAAALAAGFLGESARGLIRPLLRALEDSSDRVQVRAAEALLRVRPGAGAAIDALARCLESPRREVRVAAANALGNQGTRARAASAALLAALDARDPQTRLVAAEALAAMHAGDDAVLHAALGLMRTRESDLVMGGGEAGPEPAAQADWIRFRARLLLQHAGVAALPELLPLLQDRDAAVREAGRKAALAAAKSSPEELVKLWDDATLPARLRFDVGQLLGKQGKTSVPLFLKGIRGKDVVARRVSAGVLGWIDGDPAAAVRALLRAMADRDEDVREQVAQSLAQRAAASPELAKRILPRLQRIIHDPKEPLGVRAAALGALATGDSESLPMLVEVLRDPALRFAAAARLAVLGPRVIPALREVLHGEEPVARLGAIDTLRRMGGRAKPAMEDLLGLVHGDAGPEAAAAAARALGGIVGEDSGAIDPEQVQALDQLAGEQEGAARIWIAYALSRIRGEMHPALVDGLRSEDADVRRAASQSLSSGRVSAAAVRELMRVVREPDPEIRERAVSALVHAPAAGLRIFRVLLADEDAGVRAAAARGLGLLAASARNAQASVLHAASDPSPEVRAAALEALARIAPEETKTAAALAAALEDSDPSVRRAAREALARIQKGREGGSGPGAAPGEAAGGAGVRPGR